MTTKEKQSLIDQGYEPHHKAIPYPLFPTESQKDFFELVFRCCCTLYNAMLEDSEKYYQETGKHRFKMPQPSTFYEKYPILKEADSSALTYERLHLSQAYKNAFNSKQANKFPKFHSIHNSRQSYSTQGHDKGNGHCNIRLNTENSTIRLPKVGEVRSDLYRMPPKDWIIKFSTISRNPTGQYYCSITFEFWELPTKVELDTEKSIGIDYSSHDFYVDSNGEALNAPKFFKQFERRIAREERRLSRMEKGSNNYKKQRQKINKLYRQVANRRKDFTQKASTQLVRECDIICMETLDMKEMSSKKSKYRLGKATMDNAWGTFQRQLEYKAKDAGKELIKVDKYYPSSQLCHCCGYRNKDVKDNLSLREWTCPECGAHWNRDVNAALNIRDEGLRILASAK